MEVSDKMIDLKLKRDFSNDKDISSSKLKNNTSNVNMCNIDDKDNCTSEPSSPVKPSDDFLKPARLLRARKDPLKMKQKVPTEIIRNNRKTTKKNKNFRTQISIGKKMEIIKMIDQKVCSKLIRSIYRLKSSTFYDIKNSADKIRKYAKEYQCMNDKRWERKTMRKMQFPEIENCVYDWLLEQKAIGITVRGSDIQSTARRFAEQFKEDGFKASAGWLFQFRKRHSLITRSNKSKKKLIAAQKMNENLGAENIFPIKLQKKKSLANEKVEKSVQFRSRALTVGVKLQIVKMIEENVSAKKIMKTFQLKRSTFYDIKRDAEKIKKFNRNEVTGTDEEGLLNRRSMKNVGYPEINKSVYEWYLDEKSNGNAVRSVDIRRAAEWFAISLGYSSFKASSGWLYRFRNRHGLDKLSGGRRNPVLKKDKEKHLSVSDSLEATTAVEHSEADTKNLPYSPDIIEQSASSPHHNLPITVNTGSTIVINTSESHQSTAQPALSSFVETETLMPAQAPVMTSMSAPEHHHHPLHYHMNDNSPHYTNNIHKHQPMSLTTRPLEPLALTTSSPIILSGHNPLAIPHQSIQLQPQHQPLQFTTHHSPFIAQQPLQLPSHHHSLHPQHQSFQFIPHQPLPLTSQQPVSIACHQPLNLNSAHYQVNNLVQNPYYCSKGS